MAYPFTNVLFKDPAVGQQMVRMAELAAHQQNNPQATTVAQINAAQERAMREREANQRNQLQYAALLNQQREQDLVNQRAQQEMKLRRDLQVGSNEGQMDLLRAQIQGNKDLALLNPYGKGGVDAFLGTMQMNNQTTQDNASSEAESARLNAALKGLKDAHVADLSLIEKQRQEDMPHWYSAYGHLPGVNDTAQTNIKWDKEAQLSRQKFVEASNALIAQAQRSKFNAATGLFEPITRAPISRMGLQPQQPNQLDIPQQGAMQLPGRNSAQEAFDALQQSYLNGQIDANDYTRQRALIDAGQF